MIEADLRVYSVCCQSTLSPTHESGRADPWLILLIRGPQNAVLFPLNIDHAGAL